MKKNVLKKLSIFLLCSAMVIGCMTGCGNNGKERRGYADWIEKGKKIGWGYGVYLYKC